MTPSRKTPVSRKRNAVALAVKPVSDMDDAEKLASLQTLIKARQGLEDAVAFLASAEVSFSTTTEELKRIRIERADLEANLSKLNAEFNAFQAGTARLSPPAPQTVERVSRLAEEIGQLRFQEQKTDQVINAAREVVNIFGGIKV